MLVNIRVSIRARKGLRCVGTRGLRIETIVKVLDLVAIDVGKPRAQSRHRRRDKLGLTGELRLARFQAEQLVRHAGGPHAVLDRLDDGAVLPVDTREFIPLLGMSVFTAGIEAVKFAVRFR